jgi:hypothetical protein
MNTLTPMPLEVSGNIEEWARNEHPPSATRRYCVPPLLVAANQTMKTGGGAS